jgi:protein-tyrosine phosphatase
MTARRIPLEGSFNFRDLGGYATDDGRVVRWRQLFRADGPHALTDDDGKALAELGITTVIDLRTTEELERGRWTTHLGPVTEHHLPLIDVLPREENAHEWSDASWVARHYIGHLTNATATIANALRILADATEPVMFHCSAGKDRTGVLAAVLLGTLGVTDDDIVADYALSGEAMHRFFGFLRDRSDNPEMLEQWKPTVLAAPAEAMAEVVAHVRARYGSFAGYVEKIGAGEVTAPLRTRLLTRSA